MHDDIGARRLLLALGDGVAIRASGLPHPRLLRAIGPGDDGDRVRHHKGGVEAHAELTDHIHLGGRLVVPLQLLLELEGAALGDGAQVGLQLVLRHAHSVVGHGEGPLLLVGNDGDLQILALDLYAVIGEGTVGQLVLCVAGVGDDLPQKDLLVGVDGVDHQIHQPLGLRLELFLCHDGCLLYRKI